MSDLVGDPNRFFLCAGSYFSGDNVSSKCNLEKTVSVRRCKDSR